MDLIILYYRLKILKSKINNEILGPESVRIILYGNCMELHGCVQFILQMGISPHAIFIIQPTLKNQFQDDFVQRFLQKQEKSLGIHIYENYEFYRWNTKSHVGKSGYYITSLVFKSKFHSFNLNCGLFISFDPVNCNPEFIEILYEHGFLLTEGKLAINHKGQTNCPWVRAAGPFTQYHESEASPKFNQIHYNSEEVGAWVSNVL